MKQKNIMYIKKSKFRLEIMWHYLNQLEKALDRNDRFVVDTVLHNVQEELDTLNEETDVALSEYWENKSHEEGMKELEEEINACKFYVTLCDKTESFTKARYWIYNAGFETLSSAEDYRKSLVLIVNEMNREPDDRAIPPREGEYILVISHGPAPNVNYQYHKF